MAAETRTGIVNDQTEADALVITGAAMVGIKDGVVQIAEKKADFVGKVLEPADQRHLAHPLDDFVTDAKHLVSDISNKIEAAYSPGDMNLGHSQARQPHPIENTSAALSATYETLAEKGAVEGTRAGAAMMASVATDTLINPSGKAKAIETVLDVSAEAKAADTVKNALPINNNDFSHLTMLPQIPSAARVDKMYELSDAGKDVELVKMQIATVPYAWGMFGGASAIAAGAVLYNRDKEYADKIAQLPINEQKSIAFESGRSNEKIKAATLEKFPELKTAYQAYDEVVAEAFKKFPGPSIDSHTFEGQYGGQSEAGSKRSSYIFQHTQAISDAIKNGQEIPSETQLEKHSGAAHILEQELAALNPDARNMVLNRIAQNANTHNTALQQNIETSIG